MKKRVSLGLSLTLLASSAASAFAAEHHPVQHPKQIKNVEFQPMKAPTTIENMIKTYTEASVKVTYKDGSVEETPLNYNQLFLSKDKIVDNKGELIAAGTPVDANGDPIIDRSVPDKPSPYVSDAPDSNSFITINGKSYIISHYEYESVNNAGKEISGLPASMTLTQVDRDDKTGKLTVNHAKKIDFSNVDGLWTPCNGSTTDWGTHLGSEEYEPDARAFEDPSSSSYKDVTNFAKLYFGDTSKANPYYYGWIPEISMDESGNASVVKHYSTGRFSHEMMQVLPDNKTALFGDDGSNTMMFMYVADKEKDFSAGTLYAAKFKQTSTENGGKGDLQWIKLGHATDNEVKTIIDKETKFSDIFETADQPTKGFTAVKTAASKKVEYLKVKPGMEKAAAFLESRRYGAILGATSEFNKMEGLTVNKKDKKAYMAISYQNSAMLKESGAVQDDIQLPKLESGVTYQLNLGSHQKDQANGKINSRYVPASMEGLLIGQDLEKADAYGNTADPNKIANPDNLTYSNDLNTLFIGEDSSLHTNNFVWAYNVKTKKLSRILSVPVGAEATGLRAVENIKNSRYVLSNYQHPGEDISDKNITAVDKEELANAMKESIGIQETGGVGYISGLPSKDGAPYKKH
ncbi:PhoX family protein [Priestia megaterium]|uniref:PhoX family protein n=1 Tax=Priestia megaterium TaxID=1404 RepID=UPI000BF33C1A|nr:alkaline phosphatase PhoX [Priestia megaterium]PFD97919.1 alkaline phosphatase [Priestia megaterium]